MSSEGAYELFKKGSDLLEARRLHGRLGSSGTGPLRSSPTRARSARLSAAPTSARRASPRPPRSSPPWSRRYPVNDYAHFCLGRSLEKTGRTDEARRHAALAAHMRPDRKDYQAFRERLEVA